MFEHTRHDPWGSLALRRSVDRICSKIYAMAASNTFRKPTPVGLYDAAEPQAQRSHHGDSQPCSALRRETSCHRHHHRGVVENNPGFTAALQHLTKRPAATIGQRDDVNPVARLPDPCLTPPPRRAAFQNTTSALRSAVSRTTPRAPRADTRTTRRAL